MKNQSWKVNKVIIIIEFVREQEEKRLEEEEKKERHRREDEERETRRQERQLRKSEMEAELVRQKEAAEAAKREHELELASLGQGNLDDRPCDREDQAKAPKLPSFVDGKVDFDVYVVVWNFFQVKFF